MINDGSTYSQKSEGAELTSPPGVEATGGLD
jgi:hypothetical protein